MEPGNPGKRPIAHAFDMRLGPMSPARSVRSRAATAISPELPQSGSEGSENSTTGAARVSITITMNIQGKRETD